MSLEVRQMVVSSSVVQKEDGGVDRFELDHRDQAIRTEILDEVRRRLRAARNDAKER